MSELYDTFRDFLETKIINSELLFHKAKTLNFEKQMDVQWAIQQTLNEIIEYYRSLNITTTIQEQP